MIFFQSDVLNALFFFPLVNGNSNLAASTIMDKYKIGKVIGDGNFAVVKECVER